MPISIDRVSQTIQKKVLSSINPSEIATVKHIKAWVDYSYATLTPAIQEMLLDYLLEQGRAEIELLRSNADQILSDCQLRIRKENDPDCFMPQIFSSRSSELPFRQAQSFLHHLQIISAGENGAVASAASSNSNDQTEKQFIVKIPLPSSKPSIEQELMGIHEAAVSILGVNSLRDQLPNFVHTYGVIACSAGLINELSPGTKLWSLCKEGNKELVAELFSSSGARGGNSSKKTGVYLVQENLELGAKNLSTFSSFLRKTSNILDVVEIILQVFAVLAFAHHRIQFVHNDLHTDNVLIRDGPAEQTIPISENAALISRIRKTAILLDYGLSSCVVGSAGAIAPFQKIYRGISLHETSIRADLIKFLTQTFIILVEENEVIVQSHVRDAFYILMDLVVFPARSGAHPHENFTKRKLKLAPFLSQKAVMDSFSFPILPVNEREFDFVQFFEKVARQIPELRSELNLGKVDIDGWVSPEIARLREIFARSVALEKRVVSSAATRKEPVIRANAFEAVQKLWFASDHDSLAGTNLSGSANSLADTYSHLNLLSIFELTNAQLRAMSNELENEWKLYLNLFTRGTRLTPENWEKVHHFLELFLQFKEMWLSVEDLVIILADDFAESDQDLFFAIQREHEMTSERTKNRLIKFKEWLRENEISTTESQKFYFVRLIKGENRSQRKERNSHSRKIGQNVSRIRSELMVRKVIPGW